MEMETVPRVLLPELLTDTTVGQLFPEWYRLEVLDTETEPPMARSLFGWYQDWIQSRNLEEWTPLTPALLEDFQDFATRQFQHGLRARILDANHERV